MEKKKIICSACNQECNPDDARCKNCGKELKSRRRFFLGFFILFAIFLAPFIGNINMYVDTYHDVSFDEPVYVIREVKEKVPMEKELCQNKSFRYSVLGGNVDSLGSEVRPNLVINNLEYQWGYYKVKFFYVDEVEFPFDIYGGANLNANLESGEIRYDDADFSSETYEFYLGPIESVLVDNPTKKTDVQKSYWAIADITEPKSWECSKQTEYKEIVMNKTFTEHKPAIRSVKVKEYRTIYEIVKERVSFEGIVIFFLFIIIVLALIKIGSGLRFTKKMR